jgi:hypothetical protein
LEIFVCKYYKRFSIENSILVGKSNPCKGETEKHYACNCTVCSQPRKTYQTFCALKFSWSKSVNDSRGFATSFLVSAFLQFSMTEMRESFTFTRTVLPSIIYKIGTYTHVAYFLLNLLCRGVLLLWFNVLVVLLLRFRTPCRKSSAVWTKKHLMQIKGKLYAT